MGNFMRQLKLPLPVGAGARGESGSGRGKTIKGDRNARVDEHPKDEWERGTRDSHIFRGAQAGGPK
jgi:hypothetical protein